MPVLHTVNSSNSAHKKSGYVIGGALLALSAAFRAWTYPTVSADYTSSLSHWMDALRGSAGLTPFAHIFSDYPPLYLYLLKLISLLPGYDLYWIKTLSCMFDVFLAVVMVLILKQIGDGSFTRPRLFLSFAIVVAVPTFLVNSSLWAQCDVIYTSFVMLSLYFLLRDRPFSASLAFAVAISLKLQAIFFLPVLLGYLLARKRGWLWLICIPAAFAVTLIPAAAAGGPFGDLFFTYVRQAGEFSQLSLSAPSAYVFFIHSSLSPLLSGALSVLGYLVAGSMAVALIAASYLRAGRRNPSEAAGHAEGLILLSLVSALAVPFFLPHMHERYFYMADAISVLYALYMPRRWFVPVVVVTSSFFSYMPFLSGQVPLFRHLLVNLDFFAVALFLLILWLSRLLCQIFRQMYYYGR